MTTARAQACQRLTFCQIFAFDMGVCSKNTCHFRAGANDG